jgi:hypothetical protein
MQAMSKRPSFADYEPTVEQREAQVDHFIEGDEFLDWLACEALADDVREPSHYFPEGGGISSVEMVRRAASGAFNAEQCLDVFRELRARFTDDRLELITQRAKEQAIKDWPDDVRARLEAA